LIIELSAKPKGLLRPLPARVVHATLEREGQWIIGCAFATTFNQEELQIFLRE
jgi:hypothetical protein